MFSHTCIRYCKKVEICYCVATKKKVIPVKYRILSHKYILSNLKNASWNSLCKLYFFYPYHKEFRAFYLGTADQAHTTPFLSFTTFFLDTVGMKTEHYLTKVLQLYLNYREKTNYKNTVDILVLRLHHLRIYLSTWKDCKVAPLFKLLDILQLKKHVMDEKSWTPFIMLPLSTLVIQQQVQKGMHTQTLGIPLAFWTAS